MKRLALFFLSLSSTLSMVHAQPELNKRLQKQKAEFDAKIAAEEKYDKLLEKANSAFELDQYADARSYYAEAIQYNYAREAWLTSKMNDLDILMAERIANMVDTISKFITVDTYLDEAVLTALSDVSVENSRTEHLVRADSLIERVEASELKADVETTVEVQKPFILNTEPTKPNKVVYPKPSDPTPEAIKNDYSDYSFGITEEMIDMKNHTIQRIVVVDSLEINVYKRVKHSWGGDFTFKNDLSISQRIWLDELEKYHLKFDKK